MPPHHLVVSDRIAAGRKQGWTPVPPPQIELKWTSFEQNKKNEAALPFFLFWFLFFPIIDTPPHHLVVSDRIAAGRKRLVSRGFSRLLSPGDDGEYGRRLKEPAAPSVVSLTMSLLRFQARASTSGWKVTPTLSFFLLLSFHPNGFFFPLVGAGLCLEKRVFYRLISGLHSSINIHLCAEYLQDGKCPPPSPFDGSAQRS